MTGLNKFEVPLMAGDARGLRHDLAGRHVHVLAYVELFRGVLDPWEHRLECA